MYFFEGNSVIPSLSFDNFNSDSEQSIPYEVTPLILLTDNFILFFGIIAPGGAYIVIRSFFAFGAPQTTFTISFSPISTSHTLNLSAFGWRSAFIILAITNSSCWDDWLSKLSTSSPMLVNLSKIFLSLYFVSKCCFNQSIVNFIYSILYSLKEHLEDQIQNDLTIYNLFQKMPLSH